MIYDNLVKNINPIKNVENKVTFYFVKGPFVEIKGPKEADYRVEFINQKTGAVLYRANISFINVDTINSH